MKRFDLRLSNGRVLLPGVGLSQVDVLVAEGRVAGLCQPGGLAQAVETIDVTGLTVLPGAIDAHVHLAQDLTCPRSPQDITPESTAAAAGGVTTFLVYLMGAAPYEAVFPEAVKLMEANSLIDFGLHFCICTEEQSRALPDYVKDYGVASFKFFMNFRGDEGKYLGLPGNDDGFLYRLLVAIARNGALICPHMENVEIIWALKDQARSLAAPPLKKWCECRPPFVEAEALQRAAYLAGVTGASFYAVHVSGAEVLNAARAQRAGGRRLYVETCPHYLTHDLESGLGELGKVNPPLRRPADREALWAGLESGTIDTVGSDHVPRVKAAKSGDIWKASAGFPGLETLLPVLISEGHLKRRLPLARIADLVSTNPARIFGLWPRKGHVGLGADADLAVLDLKRKHVLQASDLHSGAGYSIYEGWELECRVVHTLVRGKFVLRDGQPQPLAGHGRYIARPAAGQAREER
ncbi:MAG: amidohydrolase family protein [Thermodesulfobacteriota bacterium]